MAGIDALEAIAAGGGTRRTLTVVAFRLEEGWRFGRGVFGSRAVAGMLEDDEADLRDADGISLGEAFEALGLGQLPVAGWLEPAPACFVETHIEQGPVLAAAGVPLGVVTSIAGMAGIDIVFTGRRGHAGTTPMVLRADALGAAARFVQTAHDTARAIPDAVCTVGRLTVSPGATNTIPGRVELFADLRAPDDERLEQLVSDGGGRRRAPPPSTPAAARRCSRAGDTLGADESRNRSTRCGARSPSLGWSRSSCPPVRVTTRPS